MSYGSPVTEDKAYTCIHMRDGYIRDPGCPAANHNPRNQG